MFSGDHSRPNKTIVIQWVVERKIKDHSVWGGLFLSPLGHKLATFGHKLVTRIGGQYD